MPPAAALSAPRPDTVLPKPALPKTMRIVRLDEVGPPENLKIVQQPVPAPGPCDILIRTDLAGLIYGDTEARRGTYFSQTHLPFFPGREVAGTVVAIGSETNDYAVGDRVLALVLTGACCAEYVLAATRANTDSQGRSIPAADIIRLPDHVTFAEALPYLVNFRLAHLLFHGWSKVPRGSRVLVHGAAGGMGSMVTQLARAQDCQVIATCRRADEADFCKRLGADAVIITAQEDYAERVNQITDSQGIEFSFNGVGGDTLNRDVDLLGPFGEIQAYGYVGGKTPFDTFRVGKCITLRTFSADDFFPTAMFAAATAAMHAWFESGPLIPAGTIMPLDDVVAANRLLDEGRIVGKLALRP